MNTGQIRFLFKDFTIIDKPGDKSSTLAAEASFTVLAIKESIGSIMMKYLKTQRENMFLGSLRMSTSASNVPLLIEGAQPYSVFRQVVEKVQSSPYMKNVFVFLFQLDKTAFILTQTMSNKDLPATARIDFFANASRSWSQFAALRTMALLGKRNFSAGELLLALSN